MGGSGTVAQARATKAPAIISHERKPRGIQESAARSAVGAFDVQSFLDSAGVVRKLLDFQKNQIIFVHGDPAMNVMYIQKGMVKLSVTSGGGKTAVVTILGPGKLLGLWCLAGQARRVVTATAMAPTTVRVIPKEQMLRLLHREPAFSNFFISYLLATNIGIAQQVVNLFFNRTEKRLIRALLFLAQFGAQNGRDEVTLTRVSQELLGEMVGSSRTHVNGFMRKLKRLGLVEYNGGLKIHRTPLMSLL